uniref:Uncharacterized protein n=1 Tax=Romanomermis culicivorax TaxID=13658 RepID=A0A915L2N3_ROMCU
MAAIINV